ncbi:MAG TPA: type I-E CRISPR-associated protein Cas6/Cse3/CasE [Clostridia bacterium]|nr:type I-E CRISPR-associated protein Cas6/Cse3/CasE [Clostridia bacterium]
MYLSRIALDESRRATMRALNSPQIFHGAIESSLPSDEQRSLWRLDRLHNKTYLLLLSGQKPELSLINEQFGFLGEEGVQQSKAYEPFLAALKAGQAWRFRLCANPVRSSPKAGSRGRVHAHVTQEQQRQWLLERAERNGFLLNEDGFDVVETKWLKFRKGEAKNTEVTLRLAAFEGMLTITDISLFKEALLNGIGRAKAYGCGLMTLARIRGD